MEGRKRRLDTLESKTKKIKIESSSNLNQINNDIFYLIILYLPLTDLFTMLKVNKHFHELIGDCSVLWRPYIQPLVKPKAWVSLAYNPATFLYKTNEVDLLAKHLFHVFQGIIIFGTYADSVNDFVNPFAITECSNLAITKAVLQLYKKNYAINRPNDPFPISHYLATAGQLNVTLYLLKEGFDHTKIDCFEEMSFVEWTFHPDVLNEAKMTDDLLKMLDDAEISSAHKRIVCDSFYDKCIQPTLTDFLEADTTMEKDDQFNSVVVLLKAQLIQLNINFFESISSEITFADFKNLLNFYARFLEFQKDYYSEEEEQLTPALKFTGP